MISPNKETNLSNLIDLRRYNINNFMIGYLNIKIRRNEIGCLRDICNKFQADIFCNDETKIKSSFTDSQFQIHGYQFPTTKRSLLKWSREN